MLELLNSHTEFNRNMKTVILIHVLESFFLNPTHISVTNHDQWFYRMKKSTTLCKYIHKCTTFVFAVIVPAF